ncbi:hypothetical protein CLV91_3302, partial [Maribacter vaceletii]
MGNLYFTRLLFCCCFLTLGVKTLTSQTSSQDGEWSPVLPFGIVPVAAANLPDGTLI